MEQLLAHLFGDYILQSDWMANNKTKNSVAALAHCLTYGVPFLFVTRSPLALFVIVATHFLIDRFRLARFLVYAKNFIAPPSVIFRYLCGRRLCGEDCGRVIVDRFRWVNCSSTGYPSETPAFMAVWLLIIADNAIHLLINFLAVKFL